MSKLRIFTEVTENVEVNVDLGEALDTLSSDEKREVINYLSNELHGSNYDPDFVKRAYDALVQNRPNEAMAYLEREIFGHMPVFAPPAHDARRKERG